MYKPTLNGVYQLGHITDLLDDRGEWNMEILSITFPQNIIDKGDDADIWKWNNTCVFTIFNVYDLIKCNDFDDAAED